MGQKKPYVLDVLKVASIISPDINHLVVDDVTARNAIEDTKRRKGIIVTWSDTGVLITKQYTSDDLTNIGWQNDDNWEDIRSSFNHTVVAMTPGTGEFYVDVIHGLKSENIDVSATKGGSGIGVTYDVLDEDTMRISTNQDIAPFDILINI